MSRVTFTVPGLLATGGIKYTKQGFSYTPKNVAEWRGVVRVFAKEACREPLAGPIAVTITVHLLKPESWPKKNTPKFPWQWAPYKKPDLDNVSKPILDACNGVAWLDDAQIVDLRLVKSWWHRPEVMVEIVQVQEHYRSGNGSAAPVIAMEEAAGD